MSIILPNFQDLYDIAKNEIETKDTQLNDFNEGSVLDVHCGSSSAVGTELIYQMARILSAFYITTATGEDLDARLKDYNIVRKEGQAAIQSVTLSRENGNRTLLILAGSTFRCSADTIDFYNENDIVFNIGQTSITVTLTALNYGTDSNILSNQIDTIIPNPEQKITITHDPFINGVNTETDEELRIRFYLELSNMARGTATALRVGALRFNGVTNAAPQKIFSGYTKLYIDTGTGTPSSELVAQIQTEIDENWKAAGERVDVVAAQTYIINISGILTIDKDYIEMKDSILENAIDIIVKHLNSKTMGSSVYKSEIIRIVTSIAGIIDLELTSPTVNLPGQASKIIRAGVVNFDIAE